PRLLSLWRNGVDVLPGVHAGKDVKPRRRGGTRPRLRALRHLDVLQGLEDLAGGRGLLLGGANLALGKLAKLESLQHACLHLSGPGRPPCASWCSRRRRPRSLSACTSG